MDIVLIVAPASLAGLVELLVLFWMFLTMWMFFFSFFSFLRCQKGEHELHIIFYLRIKISLVMVSGLNIVYELVVVLKIDSIILMYE